MVRISYENKGFCLAIALITIESMYVHIWLHTRRGNVLQCINYFSFSGTHLIIGAPPIPITPSLVSRVPLQERKVFRPLSGSTKAPL